MPLRPCSPSSPAFSSAALPRTAQSRGHRHYAGRRDPRQAPALDAKGRTRALPGLSPSPGPKSPASDGEQAPQQKPRGIQTELAYLRQRARIITHHFPNALGVDDFMQRMEIALYAFGFSGDNSIGRWWIESVPGPAVRNLSALPPCNLPLHAHTHSYLHSHTCIQLHSQSHNHPSPPPLRSHGEPVPRRGDPDPEAED